MINLIIEVGYLCGFIILMISLSISSIVCARSFRERNQNKHRIEQISTTENYLAILQQQMDKAYLMIYNDRVIPYSLEGYRLPEEEYNHILKDYINLVIKFLGSNLYSELVDYFGDESSLMINITEHFNSRYENDEIRRGTTNQLMGNE